MPEARTRVGCLAHVRRYFFNAADTSQAEAHHVMGQILQLYRVEYDAANQGILGTPTHLLMRKEHSRPIMEKLFSWLRKHKTEHPPKSPIGRAIGYALNNWASLTEFLGDAKLCLDNNVSERALRTIALGRKNFMFVGNNEAGHNLAVLQSLVGSCDLASVNPQNYLTDVLMRVAEHPSKQVAELLPRVWREKFQRP